VKAVCFNVETLYSERDLTQQQFFLTGQRGERERGEREEVSNSSMEGELDEDEMLNGREHDHSGRGFSPFLPLVTVPSLLLE